MPVYFNLKFPRRIFMCFLRNNLLKNNLIHAGKNNKVIQKKILILNITFKTIIQKKKFKII